MTFTNFRMNPVEEKKRENMYYMLSTFNIRIPRLLLKMIISSIGMILICSSIATCANETDKNGEKGKQMVQKPIEEVLKEHTSKLMSIPGVVGTAQSLCEGQPCIKVLVIKKTVELEQKIPKTLEGYPVVIQETGKFKALPDSQQ